MSVVVVATIYPTSEGRADVIEAFEAAIPLVHAEPGCELYSLHEGTDRLVMIEKWASPEALATHGTAAAVTALGSRLTGNLVSAPDIQVLTARPAGTSDLGTV
jgi:quinol monooxygenase YgiN